ncbi:MAG: hypothetical protein ACKOAS_10690 [Verrucomicrobiota bacterium]
MRHGLLLLATVCAAFAAESSCFDTPGPVPVYELLPTALIENGLCTIAPEAQADGLHATYRISSASGPEEITGTQFLANRVRELRAIATLRAMNKSAEFGKALLKTGGEKIQSVGNAVKDPIGTAKNLPQGASKFFGRVGNSIKSMGEGKVGATEAVEAAAGVHRKKAELALQLGVSPFSTDPVLQSELDAAARAMAAGASLVNFSGLLVGGGVGTALSVVNMNDTFQRALVESSPAELAAKNRAALQSLGASPQNIDAFLANPAFNPWQKSAITSLLTHIDRNPDPLVAQASQASSAEDAVYFVQMARLFEKHHTSRAPITEFRSMDGIPCALDRDGTLVVAVGADLVLWTPLIETRANEFLEMKKSGPDIKSISFTTDGIISPRALESLASKEIQSTPQALGPIE